MLRSDLGHVMRLAASALCLAFMVLGGCDPMYGLSSDANLSGPVNPSCIDEAVRSVDGLGEVRHEQTQNDTYELLPHPGPDPHRTDYWFYGPNGHNAVMVSQGKDRWDYSNGRQGIGVKIPAEELDKFAPLMATVNQAIEKRCGIPLSKLLKVHRSGA